MEGVLEAVIVLCLSKLTVSSLFCVPTILRTVTSVAFCCISLLLFTDLVITLFLIYVWVSESWSMPFQISSDVIAFRFLIFLSQTYGVVMLLTPPLIAVELLFNLLRSQEDSEDAKTSRCHSRTLGFLGCLFAWILSGIYSINTLTLGQMSTEFCLETGSCVVNCLPGLLMTRSPNLEELLWILPVAMLVLTLPGVLQKVQSGKDSTNTSTHGGGFIDSFGPERHFDKAVNPYVSSSPGADSEKTPDSCAVHRAGFVYNEERWFCPGNVALCSNQTGCFVQQQKLPPILPYKTKLQDFTILKAEHGDFIKTEPVVNEAPETQRKQSCLHEMESPSLRDEMFRGLVCAILVCVFPTVVTCNVLLILNLETLVVQTVKMLSLSAHKVPVL